MAFTGHFAGFSAQLTVSSEAPLATLAALLGRLPDRVGVFDWGPNADLLVAESRSAGIVFDDLTNYPERV